MRNSLFLASSALATLLLCTACDQPAVPPQQQAEAPVPDQPSATERTVAEAGNEIEQAAVPETEISPAELAAAEQVQNIDDPQAKLATASVRTSGGKAVGEVRSVVVGTDGKADAVVVEVGGFLNVGERAVSIPADKFTFLKDRNILVASLTEADIQNLPPAPTP